MTFDYLARVVIDGQLDVENIGDCTIVTRNDLGEEWYLLIKTDMGWTEVIEYGPAHPDFNLLPTSVTQTYNRFEFNQGKLTRIIEKFLNEPKRMISQAEVSRPEMIMGKIVNPLTMCYPMEIDGDYE
jgi:hypothetical protein